MDSLLWKNFLAALLCLGIIFCFSNLPAANQDLRPMLRQYPALVDGVRSLPHMQYNYAGRLIDSRVDTVKFINFSLRKSAHVLLYGLFGLYVLKTLGALGVRGSWRYWLAALVVLAVAGLDEQNQTHIAGRSGLYQDLVLDLTGFFVVVSLARVMGKRSNRPT